jgi:hypothetical protein
MKSDFAHFPSFIYKGNIFLFHEKKNAGLLTGIQIYYFNRFINGFKSERREERPLRGDYATSWQEWSR